VRPVRNLGRGAHPYQGWTRDQSARHGSLYSGIEATLAPGVVTTTQVATEKACTAHRPLGFHYARQRGRKKSPVFHKPIS